jgi:hypothetical protein
MYVGAARSCAFAASSIAFVCFSVTDDTLAMSSDKPAISTPLAALPNISIALALRVNVSGIWFRPDSVLAIRDSISMLPMSLRLTPTSWNAFCASKEPLAALSTNRVFLPY